LQVIHASVTLDGVEMIVQSLFAPIAPAVVENVSVQTSVNVTQVGTAPIAHDQSAPKFAKMEGFVPHPIRANVPHPSLDQIVNRFAKLR